MTVQGADVLARTLHTAARELRDMRSTNRLVGVRLVSAGRGGAPRRTGRLAGSVRALPPTTDAADVVATAGYAGPIHFGVGPRIGLRGPHNIKARPWLYTALDSQRDPIVSEYADAVDTALSKVRGAPE